MGDIEYVVCGLRGLSIKLQLRLDLDEPKFRLHLRHPLCVMVVGKDEPTTQGVSMSTRLSEENWERIKEFLRQHKRVYVGQDERCRAVVSGMFWISRTGAQWRELPEEFGYWNSVFRRFNRWSKAGVFEEMLSFFACDPDFEWLAFDSTVMRAHMCAAGGSTNTKGQQQDLGRSRGGFSTKLHIKVDALGNPLKNALTPGQRTDYIGYKLVREERDSNAQAALLDRGYDAIWIRDDLEGIGVEAVIPSKKSRVPIIPHDKHLYACRYVVECCINKLKWFRRVFTRFEKLSRNYLSFINFASALIWLR